MVDTKLARAINEVEDRRNILFTTDVRNGFQK